eukprot:2103237-Rhodomonas_salina.1
MYELGLINIKPTTSFKPVRAALCLALMLLLLGVTAGTALRLIAALARALDQSREVDADGA